MLFVNNECPCDINFGIIKYAGRALEHKESLLFDNYTSLHNALKCLDEVFGKYSNLTTTQNIEIPYTPQVNFYPNNDDCFYLFSDKFGCAAGNVSCTIKSNGDVIPCGLFSNEKNFICDNIKNNSLEYIWQNSNILSDFRNISPNKFCKNDCQYLYKQCTGGCRANAFYYKSSLNEVDPNCHKLLYRESLCCE